MLKVWGVLKKSNFLLFLLFPMGPSHQNFVTASYLPVRNPWEKISVITFIRTSKGKIPYRFHKKSIVFFSESTESRIRIFGAVEGENFSKILKKSKKKKQTFSLKFRAIFENFEKEQKKRTDVFNLVGPLKVENVEIFLWNLGRFLKNVKHTKTKHTFFNFGAADSGSFWGR